MEPNAWDRAQEAITRAEARDAAIVTPDNAVSPFDASATMIIPMPTADADLTQRLSRDAFGSPTGATTATTGAPAPRPPADGYGTTRSGHVTVRARVRPTEDEDASGTPARVAGARPPTAPFALPETDDATGPASADERADGGAEPAAAPAPSRPWWKRLFGR